MFEAVVNFYERTLDVALRFRFITLMVFVATLGVTGVLYTFIPKGFFPTQDTGIIIGITEAAQDASYDQMMRLQHQVDDVVLHDPAVATVTSSVGAGTGGQTANNGRMYIQLKPWDDRPGDDATHVIVRLNQKMHPIGGIKLYMQPAQDIRVGARLGRTLYQYTLQDPDQNELNQWAPKILEKMQHLPLLTDVTSDQENRGTTQTLTYDRDEASRFGVYPQAIDATLYDAFGQAEVAQYFTGTKAYYVILEARPDEFGKLSTMNKLYVRSTNGGMVPLSAIVHETTVPVQPLAVNHQAQFPSVTVSFNLKGTASLGDAVQQVQQLEASMGVPPTVQGGFQGTAQAFQSSLSSEPYLVAAALVAVYIILGVLYEAMCCRSPSCRPCRLPAWARC